MPTALSAATCQTTGGVKSHQVVAPPATLPGNRSSEQGDRVASDEATEGDVEGKLQRACKGKRYKDMVAGSGTKTGKKESPKREKRMTATATARLVCGEVLVCFKETVLWSAVAQW